ncbi:biotin-dependent carboxyltransferase family protein [Sporomusa acidovorans]|uniref:5-oxoprolinase subunit C n=1 Tax=Sporomusa acidovorans (strain ATCC 49682 / DSM 3132 / Mol) TaxID=1123286 RepID=A0ABZ3JAD7_SPOA4|nr:biotin-dependent carboxyltransferase family protein [Sporomusa acidovorans]OZC16176.1 KipI antagonist [Sporomusa acidovorans DSM 3132]SDE29928.1 antagonist of KipI [Sporomusa acidovorans]
MKITVLRPGLLSSIQDLGRYGFQKYGVIVSGAMDSYALRVANILVGNEEGEGALEMTLMGPSLRLEQDTLLAITGGNMAPAVNGAAVPLWRPVFVKQGSVLEFKGCKPGCRTYLAVAGGFAIPPVMGSKSTYLRAGIGGFHGRALQQGDILPLTSSLPEQAGRLVKQLAGKLQGKFFAATDWHAAKMHIPQSSAPIQVRVTCGSQYEQFTADSKTRFFNQPFQVAAQSDRMGYRLSGMVLELKEPSEMISEAVALGTVQVPPDGKPIILLADRQTAGGYPKIAQVAAVDIALIAQARPGDHIKFQEISHIAAEQLYLEREAYLQQLKQAIALRVM